MSESESTTWYRDGLKFTCTQCGDCCSGEPGFVFVDKDEIQAMADELGLSVEVFSSRFIRRVGVRRSLKERSNGDCILLDRETRRCSVYQGRPIQCRTWPFWDSNLESPQDWQAACDVCPGSGKGKLHTWDEIEAARLAKKV